MLPLDKDLQKPKSSLEEFRDIAIRVMDYLPNVISNSQEKGDYLIQSSLIAGSIKYLRPINRRIFIGDKAIFLEQYNKLLTVFDKIKKKESISEEDKIIIDRVIYTLQQSIGIGLDLLVNQNSARKHAGNRFEELIKTIFNSIGIANKRMILQIPYETEEGSKIYKCENDLIISPFDKVASHNNSIDEKEIVVSVKTTSKDRMGKMFIDKILLERFVEHPQKVIGIFLNDVQRKEDSNISFTLVSGLFMVYTKFLTELEGIYYLDPPPNALKEPYSRYMKRFSDLLADDLSVLLTS
ncbi:hypothetical protein EIH07_07415 [Chryseobacterium taklimakanense]|uniref:hypothetical protein n=1 Tax=Chryseobacterium taklimakanense TaxID=536441 RepID=UPI000F5E73A4|nr:hypothetical protein [Chryseobacterium taklimakanense]AZI22876.1 hypothetical protein EIH07_07415 [Chryseobacterium taklimakanense]